ncbi:FtsK/SpoIIIE domain-containing protein [Priestia megaterium]
MLKRTMNESLHKMPAVSKRLEKIDETIVDAILSSPHVGEGVFGFEVSFDGQEKDYSFFSPPFFRTEHGKPYERYYGHLQNDMEHLHCYQIALGNSSFLPLYVEEPFSIIDHLASLSIQGRPMFFQFLFQKKHPDYKKVFVQQYIEFLKGNNSPAVSHVGRKFQDKLLKVLNKISGFETEREEVEDIEYKIMDVPYRFEIRLMVYSEDVTSFEKEVDAILSELNYYNELKLFEIKKAKQKTEYVNRFIEHSFWKESKDQVISETELMVLAVGNAEEKKQEIRTIVQKVEEVKKEVVKIPHFQSLVTLLPSASESLKREIDTRFERDIPKALKKTKVIKDQNIKLVETALGAVMQRLTFEMPEDTMFTDFKKKCEDISVNLGEHALSVVPGEKPNTVTFLIPCSQREVIYLRSILENPAFIEFAKNNPLPFVCGQSVFDQLIFKCLTKAPHILIAGGTNSGKSVFMNAMIITLMLRRKPEELRFYMVDPKFVELAHYKGMAHVEEVVTDMQRASMTLTHIADLADQRYQEFSTYKNVRNIIQYNEVAEKKMPYVICVVDEYYDLKMFDGNVDEPIKRLTQKGRAAGIHLVIATQRPDRKVMEGVIKANIPSKISFRLSTQSDYQTVFGTGIPYSNLLGFGDGVIQFVGQTQDFIRFQGPVITLDRDEDEELTDKLMQAFKGEKVVGLEMEVPEIEVIEEVVEEELLIDKVKRYIAQTGETRIEPIRNEVGGRINLISEIIKQLTEEEGWLKKEGRKRIVVAPEEELNKWRNGEENISEEETEEDELLEEAIEVVKEMDTASVSMLQRRFRIGYDRAARLIDAMEEQGLISEYNGDQPRKVIKRDDK